MTPPVALDPRDVAKRLRVSRAWVYAHYDELGGVKIGRRVFFTQEGLSLDLTRSMEILGGLTTENTTRLKIVK